MCGMEVRPRRDKLLRLSPDSWWLHAANRHARAGNRGAGMTDELLLWIITALACPFALPLLSDEEDE